MLGITHCTWREPARGGAGGMFMPIARRSEEEYPRATRGVPLCSPTVNTHVYSGGLHHAAPRCWAPRQPRPRDLVAAARRRAAEESAHDRRTPALVPTICAGLEAEVGVPTRAAHPSGQPQRF